MARWERLDSPKGFDGLEFLDVMNSCFMREWIDMLERGEVHISCELLSTNYIGQKSIFRNR